MEDLIKTTLRVQKSLHKRLKALCAEREVTIEAAMGEAIAAYLKGDATPAPKATAAAAEPSEWHRKLTEILASGDKMTADAVTHTIDVFHDRLRPSRKRKTG